MVRADTVKFKTENLEKKYEMIRLKQFFLLNAFLICCEQYHYSMKIMLL